MFATTLSAEGSEVVARHVTLRSAEAPELRWIHELPDRGLLAWTTTTAADRGRHDLLDRWVGSTVQTVFTKGALAEPPVTTADGTLHMLGSYFRNDEYETAALFSLSADGNRVTQTTLFGAWIETSLEQCNFRATSATMRGSATLAFVGRDERDPAHQLFGAVRLE